MNVSIIIVPDETLTHRDLEKMAERAREKGVSQSAWAAEVLRNALYQPLPLPKKEAAALPA